MTDHCWWNWHQLCCRCFFDCWEFDGGNRRYRMISCGCDVAFFGKSGCWLVIHSVGWSLNLLFCLFRCWQIFGFLGHLHLWSFTGVFLLRLLRILRFVIHCFLILRVSSLGNSSPFWFFQFRFSTKISSPTYQWLPSLISVLSAS